MSAAVVYDGVARDGGGGGDDDRAGGSGPALFRNVKFWLAQKVPSRLDFIVKIRANGGGVVALEKHADMLIADLVRKDIPPNAYSWKFIDECIKQGRLVDKEPFAPAVVVPVSRPVGSARPVKGTRTPFTTADDEILTKWVMHKEMRREFIKGNVIYQQLEQKYPHHTYQSWKYRWVRKLQHLPRPTYASEELEASPSPPPPKPEERTPPQAPGSPQPPTPPASTAPPAARQSRRLPLPRMQPPSSQPQYPFAGPPRARVRFTAEDDELLQRFVGQVIEAGGSIKGNETSKDLEDMYPHHTFHSWRSRYIDYLHGREAPALSTPAPPPTAASVPARTHQAPITTPAPPATQQPVQTSPRRTQPPQEPQANASAASVTPYAPVVRPPEATTPRRDFPVEPTPTPAPVKVEARQPVIIPQTPHSAPRTASWTGVGQSHRSPSFGASRLSVGRSGSPASIEIQKQVRERTLRQEKVRREREAAKLIQRVWRGHLGRLAAYQLGLELESAEAIQRTWRSHSSRQGFRQAFSVVRSRAEEVAMTVQRLWRGCDYRARLSRFLEEQAEAEEQAEEHAEDGDGAFEEEEEEEESAHYQHKTNGRSGAPRSIKEQFHADLDDYLQLTEQKIDLWPKIHGRSVQLWDLYHAINEQLDEDEGGHCDWERVAERLAFDWIQYPAAVQEVARCYEKNLGGFMLAQAEFDEQSSSQDGASGDDEEEVSQTPVAARTRAAAAATAPTTSPLPSSPPRVGGLKRRYGDSAVSHDSAYPSSAPRKRARVNRNREIPSTPEGEIQQAAKHAEMYRATSLTPVARRRGLESSGRIESDDGQSSQQLPPLPRPAVKRAVEPETQGFRYDQNTLMVGQDELGEDEVDEVTPSQQLRSELGMVAPIPLRLPSANKAAAARRGGRDTGEPAPDEEDVDLGATPQSHHRSGRRSSLPPREALPVPKTRRSQSKPFVRPDRTPPAAQPRPPSSPQPVTGPSSHRLTASARRGSQAQVRRADINAARAIPPPSLPERQPEPQPRQRGAPAAAIDIPDSPSDGDDGAGLAAVVERYVSIGYPQDVVLRALKATTGVADGLAGVAMESLMRGEGLPTHHEGIWTARDDEVLGLVEGVDWGRQPRTEEEGRHRTKVERARRRLAHKHGEERIEERKGFLRMYRAGQ